MSPDASRHARLLCLGCVDYLEAWDLQRRLAAEVRSGGSEALILCSHPAVITLGRRAGDEQLRVDRGRLETSGVRVVDTDRGGGATAHHPGQLIGYPILRLGLHPDLHRLLRSVETMIIEALRSVGVEAGHRRGLTGVWVGEEKIASIGMRFQGGVTLHGFALNVRGELDLFDAIVPCGLAGVRMTSLERQGVGRLERWRLENAVADAAAREFGLLFEPVERSLPARAHGLQ
jgi:lipoate-protein ligase B